MRKSVFSPTSIASVSVSQVQRTSQSRKVEVTYILTRLPLNVPTSPVLCQVKLNSQELRAMHIRRELLSTIAKVVTKLLFQKGLSDLEITGFWSLVKIPRSHILYTMYKLHE